MPGKQHPVWHQVATDHAEVLALSGRAKEAHALYDEVLASELATRSTALPNTQRSRAELALAEHAWADAATFAEHSVAGFEAAGGKDNPELWRPLAALARAQIGLGKLDVAVVDRAIAIGEHVALPAQDLDPIRALRPH
jgi:hypothetical protein